MRTPQLLIGLCLGIGIVVGTIAFHEGGIARGDDCTQGCADPTGLCSGTDSAACGDGNLLCTNGTNCAGDGVHWFDPIMRGSTSGTDKIDLVQVTCRRILPCINNGQRSSNTACSYSAGTIWACVQTVFSSCQSCKPGTPYNLGATTCIVVSCGEE